MSRPESNIRTLHIYLGLRTADQSSDSSSLHPTECRQMASCSTWLMPMPSSGLLARRNVGSLQRGTSQRILNFELSAPSLSILAVSKNNNIMRQGQDRIAHALDSMSTIYHYLCDPLRSTTTRVIDRRNARCPGIYSREGPAVDIDANHAVIFGTRDWTLWRADLLLQTSVVKILSCSMILNIAQRASLALPGIDCPPDGAGNNVLLASHCYKPLVWYVPPRYNAWLFSRCISCLGWSAKYLTDYSRLTVPGVSVESRTKQECVLRLVPDPRSLARHFDIWSRGQGIRSLTIAYFDGFQR